MNKANNIAFPEETSIDKVEKVVRGLSSFLPGASFVLELIAPSMNKRRDDFLRLVAEVINELTTSKKLSYENLIQNEAFITCLVKALPIAFRTHQEEKIKILKNAIKNCTLNASYCFTENEIFFGYIDSLGIDHFRVLNLIRNVEQLERKEISDPTIMFDMNLCALASEKTPDINQEIVLAIWRELAVKGLVKGENPLSMWAVQDDNLPRLSNLGKLFLEFIDQDN